MGSKSRIAKHIVPIIQRYIDENNIKCYIEPFCGGLNVIDKVKCEYKIASDIHRYLIALFKNIDKIYTLPYFITKEHYSEVRECFNENNNCLEDWYIGAIRFLASYNGRFLMVDMQGWLIQNQEPQETIMMRRKEICWHKQTILKILNLSNVIISIGQDLKIDYFIAIHHIKM